MPIYWGQRKIKNRGDSGVYYGDRKIKFVYFGNRLVYSYESYDRNTVLVDVENGGTAVLNLLPGVYHVVMAAGGGSHADWAFQGYPWSAGGGGGAAIEGEFYNPSTASFSIVAGAYHGNSSVTRNGTTVFNCTAGGNAGVNSAGGGGIASISWSGIENISVAGKNGNAGRGTMSGYGQLGGDSVCSRGWGAGDVLPGGVLHGGVYVQYKRRWK